MKFIADFHIHSKYSRATARNLDLENLYVAAQLKGISVIGTGDFTHPAWWQEINDKLEPAQEGLFALKTDIARACDTRVPAACRRSVRFMLVTEISNIYKKKGRTRKNHNLVFLPDLDTAERFNRCLDHIGNIRSDGRPILGLDARNLLETVLETSDAGYLVPAHIWTPWFSLLGSKSGFDSVAECFEDLSPHIFALETGLSSDPAMNWRVSGLDRFTLMSNSDAHSPGKLGREANCFDTELSFMAIRRALSRVDRSAFQGTIEFYPQEGKYHIDGHADCGFSCTPAQSRNLGNRCPVCGKPLVMGVLYRVEELADRNQGQRPVGACPFFSLIPLAEILAEIYQSGVGTKRVAETYAQLLQRYGSELEILHRLPRSDLDRCAVSLLGEAIERMRSGKIHFTPGYDGIYGKVHIFEPHERNELQGQRNLFSISCFDLPEDNAFSVVEEPAGQTLHTSPEEIRPHPAVSCNFNVQQQSVIDHTRGPLLIVAGPGTGKTRTITSRMAALIMVRGLPAANLLAVTFTNKAAREMLDRLATELPCGSDLPIITTFHGLCRRLLIERQDGYTGAVVDDEGRAAVMADALKRAKGGSAVRMSVAAALSAVMHAKQLLLTPGDDLSRVCPSGHEQRHLLPLVYGAYQDLLRLQNICDFEDLIVETVRLMETDGRWCVGLQQRFTHVFVDEFQDINYGQYRLIRLLAPQHADLCAIGDPDQAIYGFRGSDVRFFDLFEEDYPQARVIRLNRNYRSSDTILQAAYQVVNARRPRAAVSIPVRSGIQSEPFISILEATSAHAEAVVIGKTIEQMVGGAGFQAIDFGKVPTEKEESSFADFAVLYRTTEQGHLLADVLSQAGIPCRQASRQRAAQKPGRVKLLALLRMVGDQGGYNDLDLLNDLVVPGISRETLAIFKQWAYTTRQSPAQAMHAATRVPIPAMSLARQQRLADLIKWIDGLKADCVGQTLPQVIDRCLVQTTLSGRVDGEDLELLLLKAAEFDKNLAAFIIDQALQRDTDLYRPDIEKVNLMTLHASKGLEFKIVFVAGCEEGSIPFNHPGQSAVDSEEERRLLFVGMTRAKRQLFLSWARKRLHFGKPALRARSSFVDDIERQLKRHVAPPSLAKVQKQLSLF